MDGRRYASEYAKKSAVTLAHTTHPWHQYPKLTPRYPKFGRIIYMKDEERCCGTGTCLIDATGRCWCGQQWDGEKMCRPTDTPLTQKSAEPTTAPLQNLPLDQP